MTDDRADEPTAEQTQARIRRAPRLPVFLVIGAVLGVIGALVLTAAGHVNPAVGFAATWAYFCLLCVPVGLVVGALVAIVLDQVSRRRSRLVTVERARVDPDGDPDGDPDDEERVE